MPPRKEQSSDETISSGETENTAATVQTRVTNMTTPPGTKRALLDFQPPSDHEATRFYYRLPSAPRLVGRTPGRQDWKPDFPGNPILPCSEEIAAIGPQHRIVALWESRLLPGVLEAVAGLPWTSIDVVRIGLKSVPRSRKPVVVWIGVATADIPWERTAYVLRTCCALLDANGLDDVEVEIRVSLVTPSVGTGPALFPANFDSLIVGEDKYRRKYSTAVGQSIASEQAPDTGGTMGMYLWAKRDGGTDLFALTCRHVALPSSRFPANWFYKRRHTSEPANNIVLPPNKPLAAWAEEINILLDIRRDSVRRACAEAPDDVAIAEGLLQKASSLKRTIDSLRPLRNRIIGDVKCSPPIGAVEDGPFPWTRDWCLIRLNPNKFPGAQMPDNVVDLRGWADEVSLRTLLNPNPRSPHSFVYPANGLLPLRGTVPLAEMHTPTMLDKDGEECVLVGKRGAATDLTFGTGNELLSVVRHVNGVEEFTSREWLVTGFDKRSPFSAGGDSGSVIFDLYGRVCGLLTGGAKMRSDSNDVTYATPMTLVLADIQRHAGIEVKMG